MLHIHIICVGKLKESFYLAAVREYEKRLSGDCKLSLVELAEVRLPSSPSEAEVQAALQKEAVAISQRLPKQSYVVALCVEGDSMSSEAFSALLSRLPSQGSSAVTFLIGGSFGLHESVKALAHRRLSFSPMTLPHHLARVLLLEQVYRAFRIAEDSPYHK